MKALAVFLMLALLFTGIVSASIRESVREAAVEKISQATTGQNQEYIDSAKQEIRESEQVQALNKTVQEKAQGGALAALNQTAQQAANDAAKQAIEQAIASKPLPQGTSIEVDDVSVTPTTVNAETVIIINGKFGGSATVPVDFTITKGGTITATASAPTINLPPGVPLTISPNENIKASTATLVIQTGESTGQPISAVSVAVQSPASGKKEVTLNKIDNGVKIESSGVSAFTTATIKVEDGTLYLSMPAKDYEILLPEEIAALKGQAAMLSVQNGTPVYSLNATQTSNFLWLIPMTYTVESTINAQTGIVQSKNVPWWASLFFGA